MYLQTWRVRAQSERARSKTAHDKAPAHRFRTSQRTLRSRSKRTRSAKQRKTSQHHTEKCATISMMLPLPSNREEFLFGNIVAEPLRARPPNFEERLQCGTWQPTTIMEDTWADQTHKEPRHPLGRSNWNLSTQHGLPCDLFHEIGRCQRNCVLCSNAPPWQEQMTEKKKDC